MRDRQRRYEAKVPVNIDTYHHEVVEAHKTFQFFIN